MFIVDSHGNVREEKSSFLSIYTEIYYEKIFKLTPLIQKQEKEPFVLCINGFLNEDDNSTHKEWINSISKVYPYSNIYHVDWESKNLKIVGKYLSKNFLISKSISTTSNFLLKTTPIGSIITLGNITYNAYSFSKPWREASSNAYKVGKALGEFLAQYDRDYILIGHSLGARVIYSCLSNLLENKERKCNIKEVHLLGGAVSNCSNNIKKITWEKLPSIVQGKIRNYYSKKDYILKMIYPLGEITNLKHDKPIGRYEIDNPLIKNINLTLKINGHSDYHQKLSAILETN